jgi:EmrB/QacA subfamily drug resistance transporter
VITINRRVLFVLCAAQFLMVLDQAVMNVSISQLVKDFDTSVTTIQGVITFYSLVMAALMITGGKLGDLWGRRRAFAIGMVIYACGSALTAASWNVASLALGWSVLEGIGAALVLPALVALVAGNFAGEKRAVAYGLVGAMAGVGVAVGPLLGGWVTTYLSWRLVFIGEVVVAAVILLLVRAVKDTPRDGPPPQLDIVGAVLSCIGLGLVVLGVLQSSTWGWVKPRNSPLEPFGFSLTLFVIGAGFVVIMLFVSWQRHREASGRDPLVRLELFKNAVLRAGVSMYLAQNLILMGIFFTMPLYLQVVQGYDAFETGVAMVPISITLFIGAMLGPKLAKAFGPRTVVRVGLGVLLLGTLLLLAHIEPDIDTVWFAITMAVLGAGMGLIAGQLGNVVQSSVGPSERSEAGGVQNTAQQLGSALGVALMGAIVIGGLASAFLGQVNADPAISQATKDTANVSLEAGVPFVPADDLRVAATKAGVPPAEVDALVSHYSDSELQALKAGLLVAAFITVGAFFVTRRLPTHAMGGDVGAEPGTDQDNAGSTSST